MRRKNDRWIPEIYLCRGAERARTFVGRDRPKRVSGPTNGSLNSATVPSESQANASPTSGTPALPLSDWNASVDSNAQPASECCQR